MISLIIKFNTKDSPLKGYSPNRGNVCAADKRVPVSGGKDVSFADRGVLADRQFKVNSAKRTSSDGLRRHLPHEGGFFDSLKRELSRSD